MKRQFDRERFSESLGNCHDIIRDNDKLSPEAAFDEISKILFIKIKFERGEDKIFTEKDYISRRKKYDSVLTDSVSQYYQYLFDSVKKEYEKDQIFDLNERLRIREASFRRIVKELEVYNLSTVSEDIKGLAFEKFLGTTFRGELGQFFTPRAIVNFMVKVVDPKEGEQILDPCCGSGGFIIRAFEHVRDKILRGTRKKDIDLRIRRLASECIYGVDANPRMARTAKMNMIMHGDGHSGVHHHDGLIDCENIFEGRFDLILTNPPFGARVSKSLLISAEDIVVSEDNYALYQKRYGNCYLNNRKAAEDSVGKSVVEQYELGRSNSQTEVLFLERCLRLLKPGGRMGIVLPEGIMNNTNMAKVRSFVEDRAKILMIVSLPKSVFVKAGADVKTSILFLRKFTEQESLVYWNLKQDYANNRMRLKENFNYKIPIAEVSLLKDGDISDADFGSIYSDYCEFRKRNLF